MKPAKLEPYIGQIVRCEWQDAVGLSEWRTEREACELRLSTVISVGHVLSVTDVLVMCADRDENGNVNGIGVIPCGWVTGVERLG